MANQLRWVPKNTKLNINASEFIPNSKNAEKKHLFHQKQNKNKKAPNQKIKILSTPKNILQNANINDSNPKLSNLIKQLASNSYECIICCDNIYNEEDIWTCGQCKIILHFNCSQNWANSCLQESGSWRCPQCQLLLEEVPSFPYCYCKNTRNPEYNPYITPHSCGEICGKSRGIDCPHYCNILCHPGPCPECEVIGKERKCACKSTIYHLKCGQVEKQPRTCNNKCNRPLKCGNHKCNDICHNGSCSECKITEVQTCFCGKITQSRPCGSGKINSNNNKLSFNCEQKCEKILTCGYHKCKKQCHSGICNSCSRRIKIPHPCACGNTLFDSTNRTKCTDPLPTCDKTCQKMLDCGQHLCNQKCHDSNCPPCLEKITSICRCGKTTVTLPCYLINSKNPEQKFKHLDIKEQEKLKEDLNVFKTQICKILCRKRLSCGRHKCNQICCPESLIGGHTCQEICGKQLSCGNHTCLQFCHLGYCKPCNAVFPDGISCNCGKTTIPGPVPCGTPQPECKYPCKNTRECNHPCNYTCHTDDCPPCVHLVKTICAGGHTEVSNVYCSKKQYASCGKPCLKIRDCDLHRCNRTCHIPPCDNKDSNNKSCGQKCGLILACGHECPIICHPDSQCDITNCKEKLAINCPCGNKSQIVFCHGDNNKKLNCDNKCTIIQRNKKFCEALDIDPSKKAFPSLPSHSISYSEPLLEFASRNLSAVHKVEKIFYKCLDPSSHGWCYIPSNKSSFRWLVQHMSQHYGLISELLSSNTENTIRVSKSDHSSIPPLLLSDATIKYQNDPQSLILAENWPSDCQLHITDLPSNYEMNDIHRILSQYNTKYRLNWLGKSKGVLIVFTDSNTALHAYNNISGKGPYQVTIGYQEEPKVVEKIENRNTKKTTNIVDGWDEFDIENDKKKDNIDENRDNDEKKDNIDENRDIISSNQWELIRIDSEKST